MRRPRRFAVFTEIRRVERQDFTLEPALGPRLRAALLRLQAERIAIGPGDAPLVRDALRALELRRRLVVLEVGLRQWTVEVLMIVAPSGILLIISTPQLSALSMMPPFT